MKKKAQRSENLRLMFAIYVAKDGRCKYNAPGISWKDGEKLMFRPFEKKTGKGIECRDVQLKIAETSVWREYTNSRLPAEEKLVFLTDGSLIVPALAQIGSFGIQPIRKADRLFKPLYFLE